MIPQFADSTEAAEYGKQIAQTVFHVDDMKDLIVERLRLETQLNNLKFQCSVMDATIAEYRQMYVNLSTRIGLLNEAYQTAKKEILK